MNVMKQYEMFELAFSGAALQDSWAQIDLTAEFTCGDERETVQGFYDGAGRYYRLLSAENPGRVALEGQG